MTFAAALPPFYLGLHQCLPTSVDAQASGTGAPLHRSAVTAETPPRWGDLSSDRSLAACNLSQYSASTPVAISSRMAVFGVIEIRPFSM